MIQRRLKLTTMGPVVIGMILIIVFGVVFSISAWVGKENVRRGLQLSSQPLVTITAQLLFNPLYTLDVTAVEDVLTQFVDGTNIVYAAVQGADGRLVTEVEAGWKPDEQTSREIAAQALGQGDLVEREVADYLLLSNPIAVGNEQIGTIIIAVAQAPFRATLGEAQQTISITIAVALIGTLLVLPFVVRGITGPLYNLTAAAQEIGLGNLTAPVKVEGTQEVALLATALDQMRSQLQTSYADLEQRVAERTQDLQHRAVQLQAAAEVGSAVASVRDLDDLLRQVTFLISERFDYYHVGVFLLDERGEVAVLRAASSTGGQRMLSHGHQLEVGQKGIVGYVTSQGEPRIAMDVGQDATFFDNPDLPETRSEMALPLIASGQILGALDVQSVDEAAFMDEDIAVLQVLANQVAVAIENANLFAETQEALEDARSAYGDVSRQAWEEILSSRTYGYLCGQSDRLNAVSGKWQPEMMQVKNTGRVVRADEFTVAVPIIIQDQTAGVVRLRKPQGAGGWANREIALMEMLAEQLSVALESARLYHDSQSRAIRERLVGEITTRVRASTNINVILQTAVRELADALHVPRGAIQLRSADGENSDE